MLSDDLDTTPWLTKHYEDWLNFMDGHQPNPFDQPGDSKAYIELHQNDYLRLSRHPEVIAAKDEANNNIGTGSVASLVFGADTGEHGKFGEVLKKSLKSEDVIVTTAGWCANVGLLEAIATPDLPIYIDHQAHASLWSGAKLSSGRPVLIKHNDPEYLEKRIKKDGTGIVCIDAYYSTDGSVADLPTYIALCEKYNCALVLDEAHSFGMIGENGGGLAVSLGLQDRVPFRTVSLSKAIGGNGGFIAASLQAIRFLRFRCHSIIFSSSPSEPNSAGHRAALNVILREPQRAQHCMDMAQLLRDELNQRGIPTGPSNCQIVSVFFKGPYTASALYGKMKEKGILFSVFAPPASARDKSFARFSVHAEITREAIIKTAIVTAEAIKELKIESLMI